MLLDLSRFISFLASVLALFSMMHGALFVTAATWRERLCASLSHVVLAAAISLVSGLLFHYHSRPYVPVARTLPVTLFFWTFGALLILFPLAWYLDVYYVPLLWRNQPYVF
jgi:hypothetical protein